MKFSYTLLKKILPRLPKAPALEARLNSYSFEVEEAKGDLLDVKLPANIYSYASSHAGLAREAAIIFGLPFKHTTTKIVNLPAKRGMIEVKVEDKTCRRYAARYFEIPKMKATPADVKAVLKSCGVNSINYIVDITNYVMLETGQPLHAFDAEKISQSARGKARKIIIRRARKGEKLVTLDKRNVELTPEILVVADAEKPLSLAGIKGGLDSGVTATTQALILEAGSWDPVDTYEASRKLGIQTDASIRFLHNLSPALVDWGMDRATELLKKAGAKLLDSVDYYPRSAGDEIIDFDPAKYEKLVGAPVLVSDAARYFKALGFSPTTAMKKGKGILRVRVPAWRNDIENFEDLAEEVARLEGYNQLEKQRPQVALLTVEEDEIFLLKDRIRSLLPRLGLDEIYTSSFVPEGEVEVANPIADDKKYLRPALVPLLLKSVADNARYYDRVRIFEVGKVFRRRAGKIHESLSLGMALGARKDPRIILELKEMVLEFLRGEGFTSLDSKEELGGLRIYIGDEPCAELKLHSRERGWVAASAEINLDVVQKSKDTESRRFTPPSKYPAIYRDLSIAIPDRERIGNVAGTILEVGGEVEDVHSLPDDYVDANLGDRRRHVLRVIFRAPERTLTDEEVNRSMEAISKAIVERHNAEIR